MLMVMANGNARQARSSQAFIAAAWMSLTGTPWARARSDARLELGRGVGDDAAQPRHLDRHGAPGRRDRHDLAVQDVALLVMVAHAEGGRLAEHDGRQRRPALGRGHHRHQGAGPVLLHLHRRVVDVVRARGQQHVDQHAVDLRVHVVDLEGHQRDAVARRRRGRRPPPRRRGSAARSADRRSRGCRRRSRWPRRASAAAARTRRRSR